MMIHSQHFVKSLDSDCIQPNAVDLRVKSISMIDPKTTFHIGEGTKVHRRMIEVSPTKQSSGDIRKMGNLGWTLSKGQYQFETQHFVEVPEGHAGWLIPRSTLNRNGVFITSGLYDSGFANYVGGVLHILEGQVRIDINTRIAQFIMFEAETVHMYDGDYNMEKK